MRDSNLIECAVAKFNRVLRLLSIITLTINYFDRAYGNVKIFTYDFFLMKKKSNLLVCPYFEYLNLNHCDVPLFEDWKTKGRI